MTTFKLSSVFVVLVFGFGLLVVSLPTPLARCPAGQYHSSKGCKDCPNESFMDEDNHFNSECKACQKQEEDTVLMRKCNATHDSVLKCKEGKYNVNGATVTCQPCTQCTEKNLYEVEKCLPTRDAICCTRPAMSLKKKNGINNCSQSSTDTSFCCVEDTTAATEIPVSEPIPTAEDTQTEIHEIQEQSASSENKSKPNINIDNNGELSTVYKAGIILGSIVVFIVVIAIIIWPIYRYRQGNYQPTPVKEED
ncbi:tumor necrosis factor receptor superfamily member 10C [Biomphalaria pfeifferi]|uniref:Tumor necrosis factor receptor superfamily member 10C n=1 Tax=Biomphalaria pfeifferi TaxID=112525 RepID=A0AAD8FIM0_BIOPF|nr:tumor necrosis factor receptor superfamily member 10C [Biomphalaria pfeifferi]